MSSLDETQSAVEQVPVAETGQLIATLREGSREARLSAIEQLAKIGDDQAIQALADALKDPDEEVQKAASVQLMMLAFTSPDAGIKQRAAAVMRQWADQQPDAQPRRDPFPQTSSPKIVLILLAMILGVILWALPVVGGVLVASVFTNGASEVVDTGATIGGIVLLLIPFLLFMIAASCALRGWGWMRQYGSGSYGEMLKFVVMMFIAATIIGLIPIVYWTGKGGLDWLAERGLIRI